MSDEAIDWPIRAYVDPIRSVLFIDDQFPTYAQTGAAKEEDRARALWMACRDRGWLCDVDNRTNWTGEEQRMRLTASDLLVLDYHLAGEDPMPALQIISMLAESPRPGLVVVYTAEPDLDSVLDRVACFARGTDEVLLRSDLGEIADLEGTVDWSRQSIRSYLTGKGDWKKEFREACKRVNVNPVSNMDGRALIERAVSEQGAPRVKVPRTIQKLESDGNSRFIQCGNLFVAIVGKVPFVADGGLASEPNQEANTLFSGLVAAIKFWNPSWLACIVALSRRLANDGSFRDDLVLPHDSLQQGLLHYTGATQDEEERHRRSKQVASDLLRRRFDEAEREFAQLFSQQRLSVPPPDEAAILHVNAFLCAERHGRHHLRVGTVFRTEDSKKYWVCVTPACDMVPRRRSEQYNPWEAGLGDFRAMTAVLIQGAKTATAVKAAERGRYIFFEDFSKPGGSPIAASVFNEFTNDPNPKIEHMFAANLGRKDENGHVQILRTSLDSDGRLSIVPEAVVVVCQLRAPYAERITHIVGGHVSRIGVDFLSVPGSDT